MAKIKYIDESGEHNGTLTGAEYYIYAFNAMLEPSDRVPYFKWSNTDYAPFLLAVSEKYKTNATRAWLV